MNVLSKLYVWSIMLEPLYFFTFTRTDNFLGVQLTASRYLQIFVLLILFFSFIFSFFNQRKIIIVNNFYPENKFLILSVLLAIFSGLLGFFLGTYDLILSSNLVELNLIKKLYYKRTFFEYFILIFNIFYFVILSRNFLKTKQDFEYLFFVWKFLFILFITLGTADYILAKFYSIDFIPRHIRIGWDVGPRFHGLAGEPRQAVVYLGLSMSMYLLACNYFNRKSSILFFLIIIIAFILTKSMSGYLALLIFILLMSIYRLIKFNILIPLILIIFSMTFFERIGEYIYLIRSLDFENIIELPYQLYVQRSSIFPLYEFYTNLINFNLIEVIFGNGLYTSGIINNFYKGGYYGISNPNSQIVRMIYEVGILGSIVFLLSMTWPIKYFTKKFEKDKIKLYLTIMLVVISVSLAIRSPAVYIFLGILTSYMHYKKNRLEISKF